MADRVNQTVSYLVSAGTASAGVASGASGGIDISIADIGVAVGVIGVFWRMYVDAQVLKLRRRESENKEA